MATRLNTDSRKRSSSRNLVLGIVNNYSFYQISRFVLTLAQSDFDGHLCLFAGPSISNATARRLRSHGVEVIRYRTAFPFIDSPHPEGPSSLPARIHLYNYRHFLYFDYLLKHRGEFQNVLLTDVKDVVFQKDPFDFPMEDRLYVAMESPHILIGDCGSTPRWNVAGYGEAMLEHLRNERMSCAGTTLGPTARIEHYLRSLLAQINMMQDAYACADQAAHNLLLHSGKLEPTKRVDNFAGPMLTVGTERDYALNERFELVNKDGTVINIVHQYDRHPELHDLFEAKVRPVACRRAIANLIFRASSSIRSGKDWAKNEARRVKRRLVTPLRP